MPSRKKPATGTPRRKRRSEAEIRRLIVKAAAEEFERRGFSGTTTARIAEKADVTEAQLFRYFGSKANLFRETVFDPLDQHLLNFVRQHVPADSGQENLGDKAKLYITELQRFINEHSGTLASLVVAGMYDSGTANGVGDSKGLGSYFEHGAAIMEGRMGENPRIDPKLMVRVSFAAVLACIIFKDWMFPRGLANEAQIREAINTFVLEGLNANFDQDTDQTP